MVKTIMTSVILFGTLMWIDWDDPDPFDLGTVVFFLIIAAISQAISAAFFYCKVLLNTFPYILSNVIALVAIMITLVIVL
jgi:hypothetical protein